MNQTRLMFATLPLVAIAFLVYHAAFVLTQTQQALVLQFGNIKRVEQDPGLKFKIPFIQNVIYIDKRLLELTTPPTEYITKDKKQDVEERVVIDAFVRYRITDPVRFYQAVKSEANLNSRLGSIVLSKMRRILANYSLSDLLSDQRDDIMHQIRDAVNKQATSQPVPVADAPLVEGAAAKPAARVQQGFGIEIVDVRIVRADLPQDISQATYERMQKNFTKEAQKFRAEGEERALQVRSTADRERTEILAAARKDAEVIRGEGDGEAARIYAEAFNQDPEFFRFYRSMQAYRKTLKKEDTTVILSPNNGFLQELDR